MHKIDTETAGENNTFVDRDPTANPPVDGTDLNAAFFNTIQEELCNIVTGFGGTLDDSEGFQDNSQIFEVLQRIGIKSGIWGTGTSNGNNVDTETFKTSHVVFHTAENFTLGALKTGAVVIVIPYWGGDDAPDSITVNYTSSSYQFTIKKGQMLIGVVGNGTASYNGAKIVARYMPIMLNPDGDMNVRDINLRKLIASTSIAAPTVGVTLLQAVGAMITSLQYGKRVDAGLVEITTADTISWMLKANWSLNQVKRVYCSDATNVGVTVSGYLPNGYANPFTFYPGRYREFVCIGFYTTSQTQTEYAVLLANGSDG